MKKFGILFIVLVGIATTSFGQNSATEQANSSATIVGALTLTNTADLKFGQMTTASAPEIVVVDTADGISAGANITLIGGSPVSSAAYEVAGTVGATYSITLPANGVVTLTGAGAPMDVDTFTSSLGATSTIPVGGMEILKVGASLHVAAAQAAGVYTGTFDVTVAYN